MEIKRDALYKTREGQIRRVICVDAPGDFPVISVGVNKIDGPIGHDSRGRFYFSKLKKESPHDLVSECREPREGWILADMICKSEPEFKGIWIRVREVVDD